jgi:hypothetical protein
MAAPELSFRGGRAQSHGTHGSARAHLGRETRFGAEEHVAAPELDSARGPLGGAGAEGPGAPTVDVHHQRENVDGGPPGGAGAEGPGVQRLQSPPLGQGGELLQKPRDKCSKSS